MKKTLLFLVFLVLLLPSLVPQTSAYVSYLSIVSPSYGEDNVSITAKGVQTCIDVTVDAGCTVNLTFQWYNYTGGVSGQWETYGYTENLAASGTICYWNDNVSCATENFWSEWFHWRVVANFSCAFDFQQIIYSYFNPEDCSLFYIYPAWNSTTVCPCCDSICVGANNTLGHPMNITVYGSYDNNHFWTWNKYINVTNGTRCFCLNSIYIENTPAKKGEWIGASGIQSPGVKPATLVQHGCAISWEFSDNKEEEIQFTIRIPQRINLTLPITLDMGWSSPAIDKVCNWNLSYSITALDEDTSKNCEYYQDILPWSSATANGLTMERFYLTEVAADDRCFHFTIQRDGNDPTDNLSDDANLHGICFSYYYDIDTIEVPSPLKPMQYNTTYYWYVNITDTVTGDYNISEIFQFRTAQNRTDCLSGFNESIYNNITSGLTNYYHSTVGIVGLLGLTYIFFRRKRKKT